LAGTSDGTSSDGDGLRAGQLAVERLQKLERSIGGVPRAHDAGEAERKGGPASRMLTPKEGKVVEPVSWGKDSAEGRWRRLRRLTPPPSVAGWPVFAAGTNETSFLLSHQLLIYFKINIMC
jgi:hypothetical protein